MISQLTKVPPGWEKVKFGDIAKNITDRIDNPKESNLENYIGLEHLDTDEIRIKRYGSPDEVEATKFLSKKGDIIFGKRRAYLRKLAVTGRDAVVSAHSMVLRPKEEKVLPEFLPWFMYSSQFWRTAFAISEGSLSPTIKWKTLSAQEFWLPSRNEQRRIAEILWSIESNVEKLEQLIQVAEKLKKGLLEELLIKGIGHKKFKKTDLGEIPEEQETRRLGEVLRLLKDGTHILPPKREKGVPILSALNISNGDIFFGTRHSLISEEDYEKIHRNYQIEKGDVLFTIVGTIGRAAIVSTDKKFSIQRSVAIFKPNPQILRSGYLYYTTQSEYFSRQIDSLRKMTAQAGIYLKELSKIKVILPPLDEQDAILGLLTKIDQNLRNLSAELRVVSDLRKKLTDSFISGELTFPMGDMN